MKLLNIMVLSRNDFKFPQRIFTLIRYAYFFIISTDGIIEYVIFESFDLASFCRIFHLDYKKDKPSEYVNENSTLQLVSFYHATTEIKIVGRRFEYLDLYFHEQILKSCRSI